MEGCKTHCVGSHSFESTIKQSWHRNKILIKFETIEIFVKYSKKCLALYLFWLWRIANT
jgi:hypothetical protein